LAALRVRVDTAVILVIACVSAALGNGTRRIRFAFCGVGVRVELEWVEVVVTLEVIAGQEGQGDTSDWGSGGVTLRRVVWLRADVACCWDWDA